MDVLALTNSAQGLAQTVVSRTATAGYAVLALALLLVPAKICLESLLRLRSRRLDAAFPATL